MRGLTFILAILAAAPSALAEPKPFPGDDNYVYIRDLNTGLHDVKIHKDAPIMIPEAGPDGKTIFSRANISNPKHITFIEAEVAMHRMTRKRALQRREDVPAEPQRIVCDSPWTESEPKDNFCNSFCETGVEEIISDKNQAVVVSNDIACTNAGPGGENGVCGITISETKTVGTSMTESKSHSVGWSVSVSAEYGFSPLSLFKASMTVGASGSNEWSEARTESIDSGKSQAYNLYVKKGGKGHIMFWPYFRRHCGTMYRIHKMNILDDGLQDCRNDLNWIARTDGVIPEGMVYEWKEAAEHDRYNWAADFCALNPMRIGDNGEVARGTYQVCDNENTLNACDACYLCSL